MGPEWLGGSREARGDCTSNSGLCSESLYEGKEGSGGSLWWRIWPKRLGSLALADILTWGAFTYPFAFLVTDLANRRYGPALARKVVFAGFMTAVLCSIVIPPLLFRYGVTRSVATAEGRPGREPRRLSDCARRSVSNAVESFNAYAGLTA